METPVPEFDRSLAAATWGASADGAGLMASPRRPGVGVGRMSHFCFAHDAGLSPDSVLLAGRLNSCPLRTGVGGLSLLENSKSHLPTTQNRGF